MIALNVMALVLGPRGPIELDLQFPRDAILPSRHVRVELIATNVSNQPVVLAKPIWDGRPSAASMFEFSRGGISLRTFGEEMNPMAQVMVSPKVDPSRFVTLKPRASVILNWSVIEGEFDFGGSKTRSKEDYARAKQVPLKSGSYTVTATYEFLPDKIVKEYEANFNMRLVFLKDSKALWDRAERVNYSVRETIILK